MNDNFFIGVICKIIGLIEIGGIDLVLFKIEDKIFNGNNGKEYMRKVFQAADPDEYPRLLRSLWKTYFIEPLDIESPRSFNEKIQWLKLHDTTPLKTRLADKYLVREWIKEQIGEEYLIPLLGVWDSFEEIDFNSLPNRFVLKCNHGSGMTIVVDDKSRLDLSDAKRKIDAWMNEDFAFHCGLELQYHDIPHKIIAEEYIEQADHNLLDYKIHFFGGVPKIIQIIGDRDIAGHKGKEIFLDLNWEAHDFMYHTYEMYDEMPPKPDNLDEMLRVAQVLATGFRYVRVDLYNVEGRILFGEMTFTPASGYGKWTGDANYMVGSWISIE